MPSLLSLTLASIWVGFCRPITAATSVSASRAVQPRLPVAALRMINRVEIIFASVIAFAVALLCEHGAAGRFGKSNGFLMIHQTFERTLRETDPRMESADDDLF